MSEQPEAIKLKRITIKTESGSRWFDNPHKLQAWCREQPELYSFFRSIWSMHQFQFVCKNISAKSKLRYLHKLFTAGKVIRI